MVEKLLALFRKVDTKDADQDMLAPWKSEGRPVRFVGNKERTGQGRYTSYSILNECVVGKLARMSSHYVTKALPNSNQQNRRKISSFGPSTSIARMTSLPLVAPLFPAGKEPLPPGLTEEDRAQFLQAKKYQAWMAAGMESCAAKTVIAGIGGECTRRLALVTMVYTTLGSLSSFAS